MLLRAKEDVNLNVSGHTKALSEGDEFEGDASLLEQHPRYIKAANQVIEIPVESDEGELLEAFGDRIGEVLINAGYSSLLQLEELTFYDLTEITGIGMISANQILEHFENG